MRRLKLAKVRTIPVLGVRLSEPHHAESDLVSAQDPYMLFSLGFQLITGAQKNPASVDAGMRLERGAKIASCT